MGFPEIIRTTQFLRTVGQPDWGLDIDATTGLTYGFVGGVIAAAGLAPVVIPAGTVALSASAVNYVERDDFGAVTANTTGWSLGLTPLAKITTDATSITDYVDLRLGQPATLMPNYPVRTGELGVTNLAYPFGHAWRYGVLGDGTTDDTPFFAAAVSAMDAAGGGEVFVPAPPIKYIVTSVTVPPGVSIVSDTIARFFRPPMQPNGTRMFTTITNWNHPYDAPLSVFRNLELDGNRDNQGTYTGYEQQQSHLLFAGGASGPDTGRLRVLIDNVRVEEGVADGISLGANVEAQVINIRGQKCFRGFLTIQGGYSKVQCTNVLGSGIDGAQSGLHIETDTAGYGGSLAAEVQLDNVNVDGPISIGAHGGSIITGNNVHGGPSCTFDGPNSALRFTNSTFKMGKQSSTVNRIINPFDMRFSDCEFRLDRTGEAAGDISLSCVHVFWNVGDATVARRLRLIDCRYTKAPNITGTDTTYAVYTEADLLANDNRLIINDGETDVLKEGVHLEQGGVARIKNLQNNAVTPFYISPSGSGYDFDVTIDGVELGASATKWMNLNSHAATSTLKHKNVVIDESQNVITSAFGITNNVYRGRRVILGTAAPGASTPGFKGDVYRLKSPVASSTYEWIATVSSPTGATWKALSAVGP